MEEANQVPELANSPYDDDVACLVWAREQGGILLSADQFTKGKNERGFTPALMAEELRENGGSVLTIGGGPQQPVWRLVAKILYWFEDFQNWFATGSGKYHIGSLNPESVTRRRPHELTRGIAQLGVAQGSEYLEHKAAQIAAPPNPNLRRKRPAPPTAIGELAEVAKLEQSTDKPSSADGKG